MAPTAAATPHGFEYEFFGPYGPIAIMLALPGVVLGLVYACNAHSCLSLWPLPVSLPAGFPPNTPLYTHEAMVAVLAWFAFILALHLLLPGERARGAPLADGRRLEYKLNGVWFFVCVCASCVLCSSRTPQHHPNKKTKTQQKKPSPSLPSRTAPPPRSPLASACST